MKLKLYDTKNSIYREEDERSSPSLKTTRVRKNCGSPLFFPKQRSKCVTEFFPNRLLKPL